MLESDLAWAPTHTLTNPFTEVVDHSAGQLNPRCRDWRPIFDADRPRLAVAGVTVVAVLRDTDNPNSVWICLDGERAVGEKFLQDPEVGKIMQEAGVLARRGSSGWTEAIATRRDGDAPYRRLGQADVT